MAYRENIMLSLKSPWGEILRGANQFSYLKNINLPFDFLST